MSPATDPYFVLGLSPRAEDVVIRAAYKALLRKYHPDLCTDPSASERTRAITEAFRILGDVHRRAAFDRARQNAGRPQPQRPSPGPRAQPPPRRPAPRRRPPIDRAAARRRWLRGALVIAATIVLGVGLAFGARALLHRHPHVNAMLHEQVDGITGLFGNTETTSGMAVSRPAPPLPMPALATIERGSSEAIVVVTTGGESDAIKVSRSCGTGSKPDVEMADYCTAFDIAAGTALGATGKPSAYFTDAPARAGGRYDTLDGGGSSARVDQIRAIVVPDALSRIDQVLEDRLAVARRGHVETPSPR